MFCCFFFCFNYSNNDSIQNQKLLINLVQLTNAAQIQNELNLNLSLPIQLFVNAEKRGSSQIIFTQFLEFCYCKFPAVSISSLSTLFFSTHPKKRLKSIPEACMGYSTADACSPSLAFQFPFSFQRKHTGLFHHTRCLSSFTGPLNTSILRGNTRNNTFFRTNTGILLITNELSTSVKC